MESQKAEPSETVVSAEKPPLPTELPRELLWILVIGPPFLGVLFWGMRPVSDVRGLLATFAALSLYVASVGIAQHASYRMVAAHVVRRDRVFRIAVHAASSIATALLVSGLTIPFILWLASLPISHVPSIVIRGALVSLGYVLLGHELGRSKATAEWERERRAVALRVTAETRLALLSARLHPHFLFNTLNAIASLIHIDADRAEGTVEHLSELLRATLTVGEKPLLPLHTELDVVRHYVAIEEARFAERLSVKLEFDPDLDGDVPPLAVQLLIENAIIHGRDAKGHVEVSVSGALHEDVLVIRVADRGPGPGQSKVKGTGTGLRTLRERLKLLFGDAGALALIAREGGGCVAELRVPQGGRTRMNAETEARLSALPMR